MNKIMHATDTFFSTSSQAALEPSQKIRTGTAIGPLVPPLLEPQNFSAQKIITRAKSLTMWEK